MTSRTLLLLAAVCATAVQGFVAVPAAKTESSSLLMVGADTEDHATHYLIKAKECAYGECSIDDAQLYLNEMLHIQSGCASGTLVGHDLCEDQDTAADVVAHLRLKAMGATPTTE